MEREEACEGSGQGRGKGGGEGGARGSRGRVPGAWVGVGEGCEGTCCGRRRMGFAGWKGLAGVQGGCADGRCGASLASQCTRDCIERSLGWGSIMGTGHG